MRPAQGYHIIVPSLIVLCVLSSTIGMVVEEPRLLTLGGRPNIDVGKCPEVRVVQNFQTEQGRNSTHLKIIMKKSYDQ